MRKNKTWYVCSADIFFLNILLLDTAGDRILSSTTFVFTIGLFCICKGLFYICELYLQLSIVFSYGAWPGFGMTYLTSMSFKLPSRTSHLGTTCSFFNMCIPGPQQNPSWILHSLWQTSTLSELLTLLHFSLIYQQLVQAKEVEKKFLILRFLNINSFQIGNQLKIKIHC